MVGYPIEDRPCCQSSATLAAEDWTFCLHCALYRRHGDLEQRIAWAGNWTETNVIVSWRTMQTWGPMVCPWFDSQTWPKSQIVWGSRGSGWICHSPTPGSVALPTIKSKIGFWSERCSTMSRSKANSILTWRLLWRCKVLSGMDLEREAARLIERSARFHIKFPTGSLLRNSCCRNWELLRTCDPQNPMPRGIPLSPIQALRLAEQCEPFHYRLP